MMQSLQCMVFMIELALVHFDIKFCISKFDGKWPFYIKVVCALNHPHYFVEIAFAFQR